MPGFDQNRFINLTEEVVNNFKCGICDNIFDNAVNWDCGHSFCRACIQDWLEVQKQDKCPDCKTQFNRKRGRKPVNSTIIIGYVFRPNLTANAFISQLTSKCDFNGCEESVIFGSLSAHLELCEHRLCSDCGFKTGKSEAHNCVELLKNDRNELNEKNQHLERQMSMFKMKSEEWELKYNEAIEKLPQEITQDAIKVFRMYQSICIGTYMCEPCWFKFTATEIEFITGNTQGELVPVIYIAFTEMQELLYCTDTTHLDIMIKPTTKSCKFIQESLQLNETSLNSMKTFDVDSKYRKHQYINIIIDKILAESSRLTLVTYLRQKSKEFENRIKVQALDLKQYKQLAAVIHQ